MVEYNNWNRKNVIWDKEKKKYMTEGRRQAVVLKEGSQDRFHCKGDLKEMR